MAKKQRVDGDLERVSMRLAMSRRLSAAVGAAAGGAGQSVTEFICRTLAEAVGVSDWRAPDRRGRPRNPKR